MWRISVLIGLMVMSTASLTQAQLPVVEVGQNLTYNSVQAFEAVFQSVKWVIDLAPLEAYEIVEAMQEDLATLNRLATEAALIGIDIESIQAQLHGLFGLETAPRTSFEFRQRVGEINRRIWEVYGYAMRTQTLINTAIHTVEHIIGFVEQIAALLGKLSVEQTISQQLGKLHQLQAEANVVTTAFDHAKSTEALIPGVLTQGLQNIFDARMEGHPRW